MTSMILINGVASEAGVPVTDSSVLRGDGCFEVLKAYGGIAFALGVLSSLVTSYIWARVFGLPGA